MKMQKELSLRVFGLLLWRDLLLFLKNFKNFSLNSLIWVLLTVGVSVYFLPKFGIETWYGSFILSGSVASVGFMESMFNAELFVIDLQGWNQISYDLILPINQKLVLVQRAILFALRSAFLAFPVLPVGKILFWNHIDLSNFSFFKFSLIFCLVNLMYGFMAIWLISFIVDMDHISNVWLRVFFPMWFLGCYQFPLVSMCEVSIYLGYAALLSPVLYAMEGLRTAIIGMSGSLNIWLCVFMILAFSAVFCWRGISLLMRRLDCI